jgi:hypothetical protein
MWVYRRACLRPESAWITDRIQLMIQAGEITGKTFMIVETMKEQIQEAGFVNVVERVYKVRVTIDQTNSGETY